MQSLSSSPFETIVPTEGQDLNQEIALMVKEIGKIGPRVPEIARRLGRHKESVRYWYYKIQQHNFAIQGIINHEALGLRRVVLKVTFAEAFKGYVKPLMIAMNEISYVVNYNRILTEESYIVQASIPREYTSDYIDLIETLKQMGVFTKVDYYTFDQYRNQPMQADYYNFEVGMWDFDLQEFFATPPPFEVPPVSPKAKFDRIDLLLAKELLADATRETQEILAAIKTTDGVDINYKTACWRLKSRVEPQLLKGYRTNWAGTRYDAKKEKVHQRSHAYVWVQILVRGARSDESKEISKRLGPLPFLWVEATGDDYYAEIAIPSDRFVEGLSLVQTSLKSVSDRALFLIADQREALGFTFSYQLFNEETKQWQFNRELLLEKFRALSLEIGHRVETGLKL
jgi:hypothetical protein